MGILSLLRRSTKRLLKRIQKSPQRVTQILGDHSRIVTELLHHGMVQAHVTTARRAARPLGLQPPDGVVPVRSSRFLPEDGVRFPGVEASVAYLQSRQLVTDQELAELDASARRSAFTITRLATQDAVREVRDALQEDIQAGGTLQSFSERIAQAVESSGLGPAAIENIYRTQVGHAAAAGQRAILDHPLVSDEFPYLMWTAVHDGRTREDHLAMESHGQNGSAVYRADDPMWQTLYPPCHYQCRCHVIPLTIADAARHGSLEAKRWLETGIPPTDPEFASIPYPVVPPEGWPTHRGIVAVA